MSKIEWTGETWNPVVGCSIVSPGCTNCYAMGMAARLEAMVREQDRRYIAALYAGDEKESDDRPPAPKHYAGTTKIVNGKPVWTGKMALAPESTLLSPLKRRKPTTYFVNSMGDLFHEDVPDEWIDRVFAVMALCPQHTFQALTKRSARMRDYVSSVAAKWCIVDGRTPCVRIDEAMDRLAPDHWCDRELKEWPLPNVWLGVSCEDQRRADERIPDLLATPAAVRFVSAEPLLGPIRFSDITLGGGRIINALDPNDALIPIGGPSIHWVIVGGESGPNARPMHPDWARSIRDQCIAAGVPFFFKQWGEWGPEGTHPVGRDVGSLLAMRTVCSTERKEVGKLSYLAGSGLEKPSTPLRKFGKSRAGRLLDGREWNEMPATKSAEVEA